MSVLNALRKGRENNILELTYEQRKAVYAWLICYKPNVKASKIQEDFLALLREKEEAEG